MRKATTTSYVVLGLGSIVTSIGKLIGGTIGKFIAGFGLAHVLLGVLDLFRPTIKKQAG